MVEITPYVGVGELQFGMHCDEVRELLGEAYRRIDNRYTPGYRLCTGELNLDFSQDDRLIAVEGSVDAGFCCQGIVLAGRPFNEVYKALKALDPEIKADRDGATSLRLGIGLYVPTIKKSKKEPVQGVIAFRKGYYGDSEPVSSQDAHEEKRCP